LVNFDDAMTIAEYAGKRLPTAAEYEFAATTGGVERFPWGDQSVEQMASDFHSNHQAFWDVLQTDPPVQRLCSGVAEWTSSIPHSELEDPRLITTSKKRGNSMADDRVVKGGDQDVIDGKAIETSKSRDPRTRVAMDRRFAKPGLGFRCYRSAKPRLRPEDY
jgi:formylglycine-generating enzyme required for sulfatase activity